MTLASQAEIESSPVLLFPSAVIDRLQSKTTNQSLEEDLSPINHAHACAAQYANVGETTDYYRKNR